MDQLKPRAFISYAHEDQESALRLHRDLTRLGIDAWIDAERLLPGQNWKVAIDDAIRKTDFFIALLSDQSVSKRGYVQKELRTALDVLSLVPASEIFIIPLRLSECEVLEEKLKALHYVDLFPKIGRAHV